jgi:hypothetical protein
MHVPLSASEAPSGGPQRQGYSKRELARDVVGLGSGHISILGHDRRPRSGTLAASEVRLYREYQLGRADEWLEL